MEYKRNTKQGRFALFLLIAILMIMAISNVNAIGITPGRTTIDFEPGVEKEIYFSVLNNEHKNMQVVFLLQGELNASITLFDSSVEFMPSEESKQFKYKVKLPDKLEPGLHAGEIVAFEVPKLSSQGTYVGATAAVVSQLYVYVACPGKCIETSLNVLDAEENGTATLIVPVINRGKVGIGEARAVIDIYNMDYEKKASVETDSWPIEAGARTELSGKWNVNVNSGNYI